MPDDRTRMRRIAAAATFEELYATIPEPVGCTGECWDSCGPIGYSVVEGERMDAAGGRPPNAHEPRPGLMCTALTRDHRCAVYEARPTICRIWGVSEVLPCNHGGCNTPNPLTAAECAMLAERARQLGGDPPGLTEHFLRQAGRSAVTIARAWPR